MHYNCIVDLFIRKCLIAKSILIIVIDPFRWTIERPTRRRYIIFAVGDGLGSLFGIKLSFTATFCFEKIF